MKTEKCSIYSLTCPIDGKIKYVGLSSNLQQRYLGHMQSPNKCTKEWIMTLKEKGLYPTMKELEVLSSKWHAWDSEKRWIAKIEKEQGGLLNVSANPTLSKYPQIEYLPQTEKQ